MSQAGDGSMTFAEFISFRWDKAQAERAAEKATADREARNEHRRRFKRGKFCECRDCQVSWFQRRMKK